METYLYSCLLCKENLIKLTKSSSSCASRILLEASSCSSFFSTACLALCISLYKTEKKLLKQRFIPITTNNKYRTCPLLQEIPQFSDFQLLTSNCQSFSRTILSFHVPHLPILKINHHLIATKCFPLVSFSCSSNNVYFLHFSIIYFQDCTFQ